MKTEKYREKPIKQVTYFTTNPQKQSIEEKKELWKRPEKLMCPPK